MLCTPSNETMGIEKKIHSFPNRNQNSKFLNSGTKANIHFICITDAYFQRKQMDQYLHEMTGGFQIHAECYCYLFWCLSQKADIVKLLWTEIYQTFLVIALFTYSRTAYLMHLKHMELLRNKTQRLMKRRKPSLVITPCLNPPEPSQQNFSKMRINPLIWGWGKREESLCLL